MGNDYSPEKAAAWMNNPSVDEVLGDRLDERSAPGIQCIHPIPETAQSESMQRGRELLDKQNAVPNFEAEFPVVGEQLAELADQRAYCLGTLAGLLKLLETNPLNTTAVFVWMTLRRTSDLAEGFDQAIRSLNLSVAAGLPRQQVDSFIRLNVVNKEAVMGDGLTSSIAEAIMAGTQLNHVDDPLVKLPKKSGKKKRAKLTDAQMRSHIEAICPWVGTIYAESSKWVHLSNRHLRTTLRFIDDWRFVGSTHNIPNLVDESFLSDLTWAMTQSTAAILDISAGMIHRTNAE